VFVVRHAIFRSVFFNRLVIKVVSLAVYVNAVHLCVFVFVSLFRVEVWRMRGGGFCVWIGNPLLDMMSRMMSSSVWIWNLSIVFRWGAFIVEF
jgi:hypothetical protein